MLSFSLPVPPRSMANLKHVEDNSKHVKMSTEITAEALPTEEPPAPRRDGGPVPCSVPSFAAASELLSAPYSCLVMNTHRRHIALPPVYLNKKRTGIKEELEAEMLKFSQSFKGVPMAYDDIKIVGQHGNIYDDSGYIHMEIEANFIVFQPTKGQKLLGKVNKLGMSHVGCLVHGCFNASIPKPNLVSMETWRDAGPRIDSDLEFEVTALDADMFGVLLIRGRLDRTRVQELMALNESSESNINTDQPEPAESDLGPEPAESDLRQEPTEESPAETPKKKKKKKRVKEEVMDEEITDLPSMLENNATEELSRTSREANGNEAVEKKKKKKKKKEEHHIKEEEEEMELSHIELQGGSDSSGYQSDKPSKKRKHEAMTHVTSSLSENTEAVKPKKKRKSATEQFAS